MKIAKIKSIVSEEEILRIIDEINNPVISICSPSERPRKLFNKNNILELDFNDICENQSGYKIPTMEDISKTLEWSKNKEDIIVHCQLGISRSSAIAFGVLLQDGIEPLEAIKYIAKIRKIAWPNRLIMELLSTKFSLSKRIVTEIYEYLDNFYPKDKILI